jgi:hypothetical protein
MAVPNWFRMGRAGGYWECLSLGGFWLYGCNTDKSWTALVVHNGAQATRELRWHSCPPWYMYSYQSRTSIHVQWKCSVITIHIFEINLSSCSSLPSGTFYIIPLIWAFMAINFATLSSLTLETNVKLVLEMRNSYCFQYGRIRETYHWTLFWDYECIQLMVLSFQHIFLIKLS